MTKEFLIGSIFFIYGLFFGSFFNVVVDRWSINKSIKGRSKCDNCNYTLKAKNLVPLLSFIWQKGKCSECGMKLSFAYPFAELLTGISFLIVYFAFGLSVNTIIGIIFISTLIISSLTDYKNDKILTKVVFYPSVIIFILGLIYINDFSLLYFLPAILMSIFGLVGILFNKFSENKLFLFFDIFLVFGIFFGSVATLISSVMLFLGILILKKKKLPIVPFWLLGSLTTYLTIGFEVFNH
jgi:prepilin signal peptidase PulO-like enzyme (type II secretory pathway)